MLLALTLQVLGAVMAVAATAAYLGWRGGLVAAAILTFAAGYAHERDERR